jgi:glycosyltransferase involved in cell wall biosynthesis
MNNLPSLYIISNDKFYIERYLNHNDLGSIINSFEKHFNVNIIARTTIHKLKFLILNKKIIFHNFFLIKTINNIKLSDENAKFLFISLTPFNLFVFLFLKFFLKKKNLYLYLRSNGFKEYEIIFGYLGKLFYHLMLSIVINNVKLIISSNDLQHNKKNFYLIQPSELDQQWFDNQSIASIAKKIKFLYIGRFKKEKGIKDFIELINSTKLNFELKIYGLDSLKNSRDTKRIKYFSQIFNKRKIINIYDKANIFILPSFTESNPKVIWESLSRLRPVIVFEDIKHVVKNKIGVYASKRNVTSLIKTVNFIINNYKLIQLQIKNNNFPLKKNFEKNFARILKK